MSTVEILLTASVVCNVVFAFGFGASYGAGYILAETLNNKDNP
jgi:hypothetical protein